MCIKQAGTLVQLYLQFVGLSCAYNTIEYHNCAVKQPERVVKLRPASTASWIPSRDLQLNTGDAETGFFQSDSLQLRSRRTPLQARSLHTLENLDSFLQPRPSAAALRAEWWGLVLW
jgi:hypothetical protein